VQQIEGAAVAYVERCGRVWRAHWLTGEGSRYASRSGFPTKRTAQQYADEREASARLWPGLRVEPGLSVGEWWLRWFPAQDLAPATLESYAQQYRRHVHPYFGERALAEITGLDLAAFARHLRAQGLAPSTVTVVLSVIRDLLVDAAAEGLIPVAPAVRLRLRRNGAGAPVRPGIAVGAEEVLSVCARLPRQESLMALVAFFTGMRWGEVCGMGSRFLHLPGAWAGRARTDVDGAGWYQVDAAVGAVHEDVHARRFFGPPKGGYGRALDLPPFLMGLLAEHRSTTGGADLLFANRRGEPIRNSDFLRRWRPACDGASQRLASDGRVLAAPVAPLCPGLRFHDLRHSHKTLLTELGVPEVLQDERLGHHPPGMRTAYAHTTTAMRTTMLEALERTWLHTSAHMPF
jgi:integrase